MRCTKPTLAFLTVFLFLSIITHTYATVDVPTTTHFGFCNEAYINFESEQTFTTLYRENSYWTFDNYDIQVENANMTINKLFSDNTFQATLTAPTDTLTTTTLSTGTYGDPENVYVNSVIIDHIGSEFIDDATSNSWAYDGNNLYIKAVTSSPTIIKAVWITESSPHGPSPPLPIEPPIIPLSPIPISPITPKHLDVNVMIAIIFIVAVVIVATGTQKNTAPKMWKTKRKRSNKKKKKWKRKKPWE